MMNVNDLLKTKHLKAYDLQGKEPVVTIARVASLPLGQTQSPKWVLYFVGKAKYLILNVTMIRAIAAFAGDETDRWANVMVQLYTTTAKDPQTKQQVPVIRIKAPVHRPVAVRRDA
jgi:hypothetical protein